MELEKQYCLRHQADALRKYGIPNVVDAGEFYYSTILSNGREFKALKPDGEDFPPVMYNPIKLYSVAELGELIPSDVPMPRKTDNNKWYSFNINGELDTEAEARAATLLNYLITKNKLSSPTMVKHLHMPDEADYMKIHSGDWPRADGEAVCTQCGNMLKQHKNIFGYDFLTRICDGTIVKL